MTTSDIESEDVNDLHWSQWSQPDAIEDNGSALLASTEAKFTHLFFFCSSRLYVRYTVHRDAIVLFFPEPNLQLSFDGLNNNLFAARLSDCGTAQYRVYS